MLSYTLIPFDSHLSNSPKVVKYLVWMCASIIALHERNDEKSKIVVQETVQSY